MEWSHFYFFKWMVSIFFSKIVFVRRLISYLVWISFSASKESRLACSEELKLHKAILLV